MIIQFNINLYKVYTFRLKDKILYELKVTTLHQTIFLILFSTNPQTFNLSLSLYPK